MGLAPAHAERISIAPQFPSRALAAHNSERARAGLTPLARDIDLGNAAAAYARQLAFTGRFEDSSRQARHGTGDNLVLGSHGACSVEAIVGGWAFEKRWFKPF